MRFQLRCLSRRLRCLSVRGLLIVWPIALVGIAPPSKAAAMTSAGKSTCTPSAYRYASSGEYAGGGRPFESNTGVSFDTG